MTTGCEEEDASDRRIESLRKARAPEVGIIYVIKDKLWINSIPQEEAEKDAGGKRRYFSHYAYWRSITKLNPDLNGYDFSHFPRGRIVFDKDDETFYAYLDNHIISDQALMKRILQEMNLTSEKIAIETDHIYRCAQCQD